MEACKRKVIFVLIVLVLCGMIGIVCYWIGTEKGYVDGWLDGICTENLYAQLMDDLIHGEHLEDADIENEIIMSYVLYTHNKIPTSQQAKHLSDLLFDYVFWGVKSRKLNLSD